MLLHQLFHLDDVHVRHQQPYLIWTVTRGIRTRKAVIAIRDEQAIEPGPDGLVVAWLAGPTSALFRLRFVHGPHQDLHPGITVGLTRPNEFLCAFAAQKKQAGVEIAFSEPSLAQSEQGTGCTHKQFWLVLLRLLQDTPPVKIARLVSSNAPKDYPKRASCIAPAAHHATVGISLVPAGKTTPPATRRNNKCSKLLFLKRSIRHGSTSELKLG